MSASATGLLQKNNKTARLARDESPLRRPGSRKRRERPATRESAEAKEPVAKEQLQAAQVHRLH